MDLKPVTKGSTLLTFSKANTACVRISILWEPCAPERAALTRAAGEDSGMIISVSSHVFLKELKTAPIGSACSPNSKEDTEHFYVSNAEGWGDGSVGKLLAVYA